MAEGTRYDLTPMAERMVAGGAEEWRRPAPMTTAAFGPGRPNLPMQPEERPRVFEYQPGVNLVSVPRSGYGLANFTTLRNLATACKEVRLNIELIKRQVRGLKWDVVPVRKREGGTGRSIEERNASPLQMVESHAEDIAEVKRWLETPDGYHDFDAWTNQLLEEMLTIDAVTLWAEEMSGQEDLLPLQLELIDGATIRPLLDVWGRVPAPPAPAYIQMLHGMPISYFSRERLIYAPLNASVRSPYGTSPVEWILLTVNLAMRRDVNHVAAFTEGNVPEALVGAPASWNQTQINTWQQYWDALTAGNVTQLRRMHWVPVEGAAGIPVYEFHKDDLGNTERDKWLMQVACWAFGNSPAEFGLAPGEGLGGKGYGQAMEGAQYRSMLWPAAEYMASLLTQMIQKKLQKPFLRFLWLGLEPKEDRLTQAQVDQLYVGMGVYSTAYVQDREGVPREFRPEQTYPAQPPFPGRGEYVATVPAVELPPGLSAEAMADLRLWRKKALRFGSQAPFESEHIPEALSEQIEDRLSKARSVEDVRLIFDPLVFAKLAAPEVAAEKFFRYP